MVQHLLGPAPLTLSPPPSAASPPLDHLSVLSYNVLLPNSVDGWWNYKMYHPPLNDEQQHWATWDFRQKLLRERIATVDADVVCFQEVAPVSFEDDFAFMQELGYDGKEMFKKGRFRPATFWKTASCELVSPPVHKDRTLLTALRRRVPDREPPSKQQQELQQVDTRNWYILNCHLQAGKQAQRRVRQINEGIRAVLTLARKLKETKPEETVPLIVCGDFNGGAECGAIRYLEDGHIDETFYEDGEPVTSSRKVMPMAKPLSDAVLAVDRPPPATLVVPELISLLVKGDAYDRPELSDLALERLTRIYERFATHESNGSSRAVMNVQDVERWLIAINGELGRGSEFREAARQMGYKDENPKASFEESKARIQLPSGGLLSLDGFIQIYQEELRGGKFWGIANDLARLGEPLPDAGIFESRYDRMYCSAAVEPLAVMDFVASKPCPNGSEPSDHLPVAALFSIKET